LWIAQELAQLLDFTLATNQWSWQNREIVVEICPRTVRVVDQVRYMREAFHPQFAARYTDEGLSFGGWNIQSVRNQFIDLSGRSSFAIFDFTKHGDGASHTPRKFLAREFAFAALFTKPFAERAHYYLLDKDCNTFCNTALLPKERVYVV
jgi:hypothetical protein